MYKGGTTTSQHLHRYYLFKRPTTTIITIIFSLGVIIIAILFNMTEVTIQAQSTTNTNNNKEKNIEYLTHWFTAINSSLIPVRTIQSLSLSSPFGISSWY